VSLFHTYRWHDISLKIYWNQRKNYWNRNENRTLKVYGLSSAKIAITVLLFGEPFSTSFPLLPFCNVDSQFFPFSWKWVAFPVIVYGGKGGEGYSRQNPNIQQPSVWFWHSKHLGWQSNTTQGYLTFNNAQGWKPITNIYFDKFRKVN